MYIYQLYTIFFYLCLQNIFDHDFNEKSIRLLLNIYMSAKLCQIFIIGLHRIIYLKSRYLLESHIRVLEVGMIVKEK